MSLARGWMKKRGCEEVRNASRIEYVGPAAHDAGVFA